MVKKKIFNDPVYRLMRFDYEVLYRIIDHPYFQRLRRISQLALSHYVFPGGQHSRYQHALGALHLMSQSLHHLKNKGILISDEECKGACIAILLHDVGHGPFSHALEGMLLPFQHECISLKVMEIIEKDLQEDFSVAKSIYQNQYHRPFLNQLVSSQLDMDRMDYLNRDSFFSGVAEGIIGYDRIISMLNVVNDNLVVEENGIHSVEKFLVARKLMYWQVYLHKAAIGAEQILVSAIQRCITLIKNNYKFYYPETLQDIIHLSNQPLRHETVAKYLELDDIDLMYMLKKGVKSDDKVLSALCDSLINRKLFKTILLNEPESDEKIREIRTVIANSLGISFDDSAHFVRMKKETFLEYNIDKGEIMILLKDDSVVPFSVINPEYSRKQPIVKYALCYWQPG